MSISGKHSYRFGFLKSEEWEIVRSQCLVRDDAKCRLCGIRNLQNDAHHLVYRIQWKKTKVGDLVTLCRECHSLIHLITKVRNENKSEPFGTTLKTAKSEFDSAKKLLLAMEAIYKRFEMVAGIVEEKNRNEQMCAFCTSKQRHILADVFSFCLENNNSATWNVRLCDACYAQLSSQAFDSISDARNYAKKQFVKKSLTIKNNGGNPEAISQ